MHRWSTRWRESEKSCSLTRISFRKSFDRKLSMDYDWKRAPLAVRTSHSFGHVAFSTRPWETLDQFRVVRDVVERNKTPPMKTEDDFYSPYSSIEKCSISVKKRNQQEGREQDRAVNLLRKNLCAALYTSAVSTGAVRRNLPPRFSATALANAMTNAGMHCTRHNVENGKKAGVTFRCQHGSGHRQNGERRPIAERSDAGAEACRFRRLSVWLQCCWLHLPFIPTLFGDESHCVDARSARVPGERASRARRRHRH